MQTNRFPKAEFVPTKTSGLAMPLAASGDLTFTLTGNMTIHGVAKGVTFDVKATRSGSKLTATATAAPTWKFGDFGIQRPSVFTVLSIVDEIKLAVSLVATQATQDVIDGGGVRHPRRRQLLFASNA